MRNLDTNGGPTPANPLTTFLDAKQERLGRALPKRAGVDWDLWTSGFLAAAADDPDIVRCCEENPNSVARVAMECATLGLVPGRALGLFHLIPRRMRQKQRDGSSRRVLTLTYIVGYHGLVELAYRHPKVELIQPVLVYRDDQFLEQPAHPTTPIQHERTLDSNRSDDSLVGGYCLAWLTGAQRPVVAGPFDRNTFDKLAKGADTDAWRNNLQAMALKTLVRRIANRIPRSTDLQRAMQMESVLGDANVGTFERDDDAASPSYSVVRATPPERIMADPEAAPRAAREPAPEGDMDLGGGPSPRATPGDTEQAFTPDDAPPPAPELETTPAPEPEPPTDTETDSLTGNTPPTIFRTKVQRPRSAKPDDFWLKEKTGVWSKFTGSVDEKDPWTPCEDPTTKPAPTTIVVMDPPVCTGFPQEDPLDDVVLFNLADGVPYRFVVSTAAWEPAVEGTAAYTAIVDALVEQYRKDSGKDPSPGMTLPVIAAATVPF